MASSQITDEQLLEIKKDLENENPGKQIRSWQIKERLASMSDPIFLDESTIRGKFIGMGIPLGTSLGKDSAGPVAPKITKDILKKKLEEHAKKFGIEQTKKLMEKHGIENIQTPPPDVDINEVFEEVEFQLTGKRIVTKKPTSKPIEIVEKSHTIPDHLKMYVPNSSDFTGYIERPLDKRLALHYDSSRAGNWKYPLTQGKQGTGKTFSHMYYAFKKQLPFYLFCAHEEFKLHKLFGDKTIINGNVEFKEGLLTQAIQHPGVILIDEVNYISNENSVDFHAFLQNRELFVKDANNGNGKIYRLHDDCKVGFAQNPKSAKYIGGNIKPSNFLGRCTYLTYPEFTKADIDKAITAKFPNLVKEDITKFREFYFACTDTIEQAQIPVDISIRQLNNVIDLYNHGAPLKEAIEDGLASIMEAASQPKNKEAFITLAKAVWKDLMNKTINETVGEMIK